MGKTHSRRGASAAPAQEPPSRKRRRGKRARVAAPARAFPGDVATGSPSASAINQTKPTRAQAAAPQATAPLAVSAAPPLVPLDAAARGPGPSLRLDIPRPPLRTLLLRARRRGVFVWQRGSARVHAGAARTAAYIVARLDAYVWQPVMWPFRLAQREMLARTLAVLSLAAVAAGWIVAYSALAPTDAARPAAAPPVAASKPFTARVVSRALPRVKLPKPKAPALHPPHW